MAKLPLASSSVIDWPAVVTSAGLSLVIGVVVVCVYSLGVVGTGQFLARRRGGNGPLGLVLAVGGFAVAAACVAGGIFLLIDKTGSG